MYSSTPVRTAPIALSPSVEGQVYALFALAVGLTAVGVFLGIQFVSTLFAWQMPLLIAELALVFTAGWWSRQAPLNYLLFALFPIFSGLTVTPFLLYVTTAYANGFSILLNALASTALMAGAAAVFARSTRIQLSAYGRVLLFGVIGLLIMGLLQVFIPSLRGGLTEILVSGAGIAIFAAFLAFDIQRIQRQSQTGDNAFLLALSLYLDIYNLFLYVIRFMLAISGNSRN
jgi:uncharacterized protein